MKKILITFFLVFFLPAFGFSKTVIRGLTWETAPGTEVRASTSAVYAETAEFSIKGTSFNKLRTVITLDNSSETKEMGIVLRYSFRLKIKNEETGEEFWEVPYQADALRVPVVKAGVTKDAKIFAGNLKLKDRIKRLQNIGYIPTALKIEVMLSPRKGVSEDGRISEAVLPIKYEPAPQKKPLVKLPLKKQ